MECAFLVLQLCLFDPANLSLEGDISWKVGGNRTFTVRGEPYTGAHGRIALNVEVPLSERISLSYGYEHRSFVESGLDDGAEFFVLELTWKPFR